MAYVSRSSSFSQSAFSAIRCIREQAWLTSSKAKTCGVPSVPVHSDLLAKTQRPRLRTGQIRQGSFRSATVVHGNSSAYVQVCRAGHVPIRLPAQLRPLVSSKLIQGGVALVILAAVDAAYSGDWSRIGVISKDTEAWLQSALKALAAWHVLNAIAAYIIADKKSKATLPVTAKVLAIGTLPLVALILEVQEDT